ncbi:protein phosphatase 2C [Dictyostelium discoideum AX4]|uniref:Protein phosphatase 2C n=1 Tax=Dictyostelium discoideum TaxID=44689 RepID=Q54GL8_DICDI|nr:protein phosphatase 2C [Dictyostelium discoideum AX4]EAL62398.1 protein phosphatase 2C [Dictyostelium discoideum AX4]|eukprot:XP_635899.1 protein phosphatase 2C [Dictyostelium discoideum AX4]
MDTAVANDSGYEISWISDNYLKFIIKKSPVKKTTTTTTTTTTSSSSPSSSTTTTPTKSTSPPKNKRERLQLDNVDEDDSNYKLPSLDEFKTTNTNNENSNKNTVMDSNNNNNSNENIDTLLNVPELTLKDFNNKKQKKQQKHQKHKKQQKHPKDVVFKDLEDSNILNDNPNNIEKQPMDIQSMSKFVLNPPPLDSPTPTTTTPTPTTTTTTTTTTSTNNNKDEEKDVKLEENEKEEEKHSKEEEQQQQQKEEEEILDLNYSGNTVLGTRDENQDTFFQKNFKSEGIRVIGVFDGHGDEGMDASATTRDIISKIVEKEIVNSNDNKKSDDFYDKCITSSFLEANEALLEKGKITGDWGTTATLAIIKDNHIRVGWVGDSMAVLFKQSANGKDYTPIQLSNDHKPENPLEKKRIITTGGRVVFRCGCYRVIPNKNDYSNDDIMKQRLALNMSRALGHVVLSKYGVSSTPEFQSESLNPGDYVIVASDGLWNVLDFKACCKYIKKSTSVKELTDLLLSVVESKCQSFKIPCDNVTICCYKHS